mmetsp:Transcript_11373/g.21578  ORF Transcript_11373/g.21578 Transcript_11373/m.21578 type:complete len:207 (-) Transcript_11373:396-1016(-)
MSQQNGVGEAVGSLTHGSPNEVVTHTHLWCDREDVVLAVEAVPVGPGGPHILHHALKVVQRPHGLHEPPLLGLAVVVLDPRFVQCRAQTLGGSLPGGYVEKVSLGGIGCAHGTCEEAFVNKHLCGSNKKVTPGQAKRWRNGGVVVVDIHVVVEVGVELGGEVVHVHARHAVGRGRRVPVPHSVGSFSGAIQGAIGSVEGGTAMACS